MKAGWIFCKNDGANGPKIPTITSGGIISQLEIHRLTGGPVGNEHDHALIGGRALPSLDRAGETDEHHYHEVVWFADDHHILTTGATNHNHTLYLIDDVLAPHWYLSFLWAHDDDFQTVIDDAEVYLAAEVALTLNGTGTRYDVGAIDSTPWTAGERTTWENRIRAVLAVELHPGVTTPERLVRIFAGSLVGRPEQRPEWIPPSSVVATD